MSFASPSGLGGYKIELEVFEGPLDLLLHLVRKHELDILDIPISFVTKKYLEYLDLMKYLNLDVAGEYLLMAATLAHIKSRQLLPVDPNQEEEEEEPGGDPREELIRRLLEYQKYRDAAEYFAQRPVLGRNIWRRGSLQSATTNIEGEVIAPLAEIPVIKLVAALDAALTRAKIKIAHTVNIDFLSVSDRINQLVDRLEVEESFPFLSCFSFTSGEPTPAEVVRHEAVVTLLAILEMAKLGLIRISQPPTEDDVEIRISAASTNLRDRAQATLAADEQYQ